MEGSKYTTKESVLRRAQEAIGIPLSEIDKTGRLVTGKGAIGTVLEESWFGYSPNAESEPDFPEAGVELKATPYLKTASGRTVNCFLILIMRSLLHWLMIKIL